MVKNLRGGNKTKNQARKNFSQPSNYKLRKSQDINEIYAVVTKLYGNGRVLIRCNDGLERNCVIRKKFRGRNKRDNEVSIGSFVLAGKREWENKKPGKLEVCDLLEVYTLQDRNELKSDSSIHWNVLQTEEDSKQNNEEIDFLNIGNSESEEEEENNEETGYNFLNVGTTTQVNVEDCFGDEVNIDDI